MTDGPRIEGYPDLDRDDWVQVPSAPFVDHVGLVFDLLSPDRIEGHLEADERHHQPYGLVHGGVYCTVVETMASVGAALRVLKEGRAAVGVSNTTDFLRSVRHGRIDAVATPVRRLDRQARRTWPGAHAGHRPRTGRLTGPWPTVRGRTPGPAVAACRDVATSVLPAHATTGRCDGDGRGRPRWHERADDRAR